MNLHGKLLGGIKQLGQNGGRFAELRQMRRAQNFLRVSMQKLRKAVNGAVILHLADPVAGGMICASVSLNAGSDPVLRKPGIFR